MSTTNKSAAINKIKQQQAQAAGKGSRSDAVSPAAASTGASSVSSLYSLPSRAGRGRWAVDLVGSRTSVHTLASGSGVNSHDLVPAGFLSAPGGHVESRGDDDKSAARDEAKQADLLYKSAMAMAQAPGKQLFMTAFMLWMSGNSLQIFSIMMLGMALWTPLSELFSVQTKFIRYADSGIDLIMPKIVFILMNLAGLGVALYKCNSMGLLPTSSADWINISVRTPVQVAGGGII